ncbi:MAG: ISL3 family transposase [Gemmatimonadaceae bacterium]
MLGIPGATVISVTFDPRGIVVRLRQRRRHPQCSCGHRQRAVYDRSVRRWRHLDLGGMRLFLEAEIRRMHCSQCDRVRTEAVPWARPGARHSRDLQDVIAYMAQRMDKTTITRLLRVSWEAVAKAVVDVVADHLDTHRLHGLFRLGVDEVSYRKGHRYLTVVADHDRAGAVVWAGEGRSAATLDAFYDELGDHGCAQLEAVSMDLGPAFSLATTQRAPQARQCVDPFHVIQLANKAIDDTRRREWNATRRPRRRRGRPPADAAATARTQSRWVKHTRWALVKDPDALSDDQLDVLHQLRLERSPLYRCWQLKEGLRDLFRLRRPADAPRHLAWWLNWASRSRLPAFVALAATVRANRDRILAAVELGLSNSKLEGLNSKIRLINHRGYGHHSAAALISMIYLCCGGITVTLPFS